MMSSAFLCLAQSPKHTKKKKATNFFGVTPYANMGSEKKNLIKIKYFLLMLDAVAPGGATPRVRPLLKGGPTGLGGGGGGWVGPWPVGGWVSLVLGNLAQGAYSPPGGGGWGLGGWVGGWVGRGWVGPDSPKLTG